MAYGETKAPADVDTLRDEECPVCGERDSYDGNSCQKCGFDAPPQMFQDPDLGAAKALDLRKDIGQDAGTLPGAVTDQDANAGMPGEVPGSGIPGSDEVPTARATSPRAPTRPRSPSSRWTCSSPVSRSLRTCSAPTAR